MGGGVELVGGEEEFGVFHAFAVGGFEKRIWGEEDAFVDPAALVAAEPGAVGGHGEHGGEGGHGSDFIGTGVRWEGIHLAPGDEHRGVFFCAGIFAWMGRCV